jgi:hypothetical protein
MTTDTNHNDNNTAAILLFCGTILASQLLQNKRDKQEKVQIWRQQYKLNRLHNRLSYTDLTAQMKSSSSPELIHNNKNNNNNNDTMNSVQAGADVSMMCMYMYVYTLTHTYTHIHVSHTHTSTKNRKMPLITFLKMAIGDILKVPTKMILRMEQ